jgi:hypothetical protein
MVNELKGPSNTLIRKYIENQQVLEFKTLNNDTITGKIKWLDTDILLVKTEDEKEIMLMKNAIAYLSIK